MCFKYPFDVFKCGKCPECLQEKRREWSIRLQLHTFFSDQKPFFAHLTYDNRHVPINEFGELTLSKIDVQKFIKRLRQSIYAYCFKNNKMEDYKRVKYYVAGEYGPNGTHRPHYHIVLFGLPKDWQEDEARLFLQKNWQNGMVRDTSCWLQSYAQLHYATKYMINYFDEDFAHKEKPFRLCSSGFGKPFIDFARENNLYHVEIQKLFKCRCIKSKVNDHLIPVQWYNEDPLQFDFEDNVYIVNKYIREFPDFIEFEEVFKGKPKVYRYPMPRYFAEKLYTEDFRRALAVVKKFKLAQSHGNYYNNYGDYDKISSVPMWLQLKRYTWEKKKKNKKDKKININNVLND